MSLHGYSNGDEYDNGSDVDNVTLISKLDVSHPLHLHPNDFVALTVFYVKLKGTQNYQVWSYAMLLALEGKNKSGFTDGSCRRSNTNEVLGRQWDTVNVAVLGWILNSIYKELFLVFVIMSLHGYSNGDEYDNGSDVDNVTLISKLDVSHPLHLHPNDFMALTIFSVKLKGTQNYQVWSYAMLLALEGKNKTGFIDGSCRRSNTDEVLGRQWDRVNVMVLGWILNSISFLGTKNYQVWSCAMLLALEGKNKTRFIDGSCRRCTCHAANDFKKHNKLMKLLQFIMGLNDTYMQIISYILSGETLFDVRSTYAIISSEKSYRIATVPEYCVSLMSVHKVSRDSKLVIAFDELKCYILNQDLKARKVLGTDRQFDGLYYFDGNQDRELRVLVLIMYGTHSSHSGSISNTHNNNEGGHCMESDTVATENDSFEPKSFEEASKHQPWIDAMNSEMDAIYRNNTWDLVELPKGRKAIGSKWVWKIKYKSDREIERYNARLVAKGFNQKKIIFFDETFSPMDKFVSIRCLINLVVQNGWTLYQMDVNNAFLYGDLNETMYMSLPPSYFPKDETRVCKLNKSLYGLKQTLRKWNSKLTSSLIEYDIIIIDIKLNEINKFKQFLKNKFMIKDLGKLKYFLGIEVLETLIGVYFSQRKYCLELIDEFGFLASKHSYIPMQPNISLSSKPKDDDPLLDNIIEYQKLIGIRYAKTQTLRGKVFDETRAKVRLGQVKTHVLPFYEGFHTKVEIVVYLTLDRRRQIQNEDLRTKLEYFSDEYDEEKEMEPRPSALKENPKVEGLRNEEQKIIKTVRVHVAAAKDEQPGGDEAPWWPRKELRINMKSLTITYVSEKLYDIDPEITLGKLGI
uniref:Ribonuclease H-like domain-containing protein n=1 Tax=Tanacetum cinerariifolium TaxID=118510 RepID=A0A6L2N1U4_TANCI|nr:ribonuclease H-like domain-containing protein [Tanacetum cinerariifolium]